MMKMNSINRIVTLFVAATLTIGANAVQNVHDNYVGVHFGGGMNTLVYHPANGLSQVGAGFDAGLHYGHFFLDWIGLGVGAQFSWANAYAVYNYTEITPNLTHVSNPKVPYNLHTRFNAWRERQNIGTVSIPVEVLFRHAFSDRWAFIGGVGAQLDIPMYGKYSAKSGSYTTSGVFPAVGEYELKDLPEHGFTTYTDINDRNIRNLAAVGASVIGDAGLRVALSDYCGLYMGVYMGYGFLNILASQKSDPMLVVNSTNPRQIDYNGSFRSKEVAKVNPLNFGMKIAIDFGWPVKTEEDTLMSQLATLNTRLALSQKDTVFMLDENSAMRDSLLDKAQQDIAALQDEIERLRRDLAEQRGRERMEKDEVARRARDRAWALSQTHKIYYRVNTTEVIAEDEEQFLKMVQLMYENDDFILNIKGSASQDGTVEVNERLSASRAEDLKAKFVAAGIAPERIVTSHGIWHNTDKREGRSARCRFTIAK